MHQTIRGRRASLVWVWCSESKERMGHGAAAIGGRRDEGRRYTPDAMVACQLAANTFDFLF